MSATVNDGDSAVPKDGQLDHVGKRSVVGTDNAPLQEDHSTIELWMPSGLNHVTNATLDLNVFATAGPYPFDVGVFGYSGDGVETLSDFSAGSQFASFVYAGERSVGVDLRAWDGIETVLSKPSCSHGSLG